jgi:hypothetical protein
MIHGLMLKEVRKGWIFTKRYYQGSVQNVHNFYVHYFHYDADWFDSLTDEQKQDTYKREHKAGMETTLIRGGYPE